MTQDLNEQFINPELQDIQEPLTGPSEASLFELDALPKADKTKFEEELSTTADKQTKEIFDALNPIPQEEKTTAFLVNGQLKEELPQPIIDKLHEEKLPDPPTEEQKKAKKEEIKAEMDAEIEGLDARYDELVQSGQMKPLNDRRRKRWKDKETELIQFRAEKKFSDFIKEQAVQYRSKSDAEKNVLSVTNKDNDDIYNIQQRINYHLSGNLQTGLYAQEPGVAYDTELEEKHNKTILNGVNSIQAFQDAYVKGTVKKGDIFRAYNTWGRYTDLKNDYSYGVYLEATEDENGNKVVRPISRVTTNPITGQPSVEVPVKDMRVINMNPKLDSYVNKEERISAINADVASGLITKEQAAQSIQRIEQYSTQVETENDVKPIVDDPNMDPRVKAIVVASSNPEKFNEILSKANDEKVPKEGLFDYFAKFITTKAADVGLGVLEEAGKETLTAFGARKEAEIPRGVLAAAIKKDPTLPGKIIKVLDKLGDKANQYLSTREGIADIMRLVSIEEQNQDIEVIANTANAVMPEMNNAVNIYKNTANETKAVFTNYNNELSAITEKSGYNKAFKAYNDAVNELKNSSDKDVRDAYRFIMLQAQILDSGSDATATERMANLSDDDREFIRTAGKELQLNKKDLMSSVYAKAENIYNLAQKAKSLFPEKELKEYEAKNKYKLDEQMAKYKQQEGQIKQMFADPKISQLLKDITRIQQNVEGDTFSDYYYFPTPSDSVKSTKSWLTEIHPAFGIAVGAVERFTDILSGTKETIYKMSGRSIDNLNLTEKNLAYSLKTFGDALGEIQSDDVIYNTAKSIGAATADLFAIGKTFRAFRAMGLGGQAGTFSYMFSTGFGRSMSEAAAAGLDSAGQVTYGLIETLNQWVSEMVTGEANLFKGPLKKSVLTKDLVERVMAKKTRKEALKEIARTMYKASGKTVTDATLETIEEVFADAGNYIIQSFYNERLGASFNPSMASIGQNMETFVSMLGASVIFKGAGFIGQEYTQRQQLRQSTAEMMKAGLTKPDAILMAQLVTPTGVQEALNIMNDVYTGKIDRSEVDAESFAKLEKLMPIAMEAGFAKRQNLTIEQKTVAMDNMVKANDVMQMVERGEITQQGAQDIINTLNQNAEKALTDVQFANKQFGVNSNEMTSLIYQTFGLAENIGRDNLGALDARTREQIAASQVQQMDTTPLDRDGFIGKLNEIYVENEDNAAIRRAAQNAIAKNPEGFLTMEIQSTKNLIEKAKADYELASKQGPASMQLARIDDLTDRLTLLENTKSRYLNSQQYATEISTGPQQEVGQPSDIVQPTGVEQGQQEVGQGEGGVGQAAQPTADARNRNFGSQAKQAFGQVRQMMQDAGVSSMYMQPILEGQELDYMDELASQVMENQPAVERQFGKAVVDRVNKYIADTGLDSDVFAVRSAQQRVTGNRVAEARNALIEAINQSNAPANTANKKAVKTLVERLKKAFPNVKVIMDKKGFQAALKDEAARDLMTKGGVVYGRVLNGDVYLNPDYANYNTPIHEFGHLWLNAAKEIAPAVYNRGRELIRDSEYMAKLQADPLYEGLSAEEIENEALATAIGDRGEQFVNEVQKQGFRNWVRRLIGKLSQYVGIFNLSKVELDLLTLDEFLNRANASLLAGEAVTFNKMSDRSQFMARPEGLSIVDGWYSPIERRLLETKIEKQSANKWLGIVGSKDEAIYTGVKGWLEGKNPQEQVTKQEILDWMKDNRVEIVEVTKGAKDKMSDTKYFQYQLEGERENYKEILVTLPSKKIGERFVFNKYRDRGLILYISGLNISVSDNVVEEEANKLTNLSKEDLLSKAKKEYEFEGRYDETAEEKQRTKERYDEIVDKINNLKKVDIKEGSKFKSTHFDEANILVHLRMNTRIDADGNKVLFLEEIQSDWGQKGKREGFSKPADTQLINKLENEKQDVLNSSESYRLLNNKTDGNLSVEVFDAIQSVATNMIDNQYSTDESRKERFLEDIGKTLNYWSGLGNPVPKVNQEELSNFYDIYIKELKDNNVKIKGYGTSYRIASIENKIEEINQKIADAQEKVAVEKAPFVTDTNAWTKLGLKMALREAVAQGVDKIAWTTGEQQNERYDLAKQVDKVKIYKYIDGGWDIVGIKNEDVVFEQSDVQENKLDDYVGKELAEKIKNDYSQLGSESGTKIYSGDDLKVGGKGMKGFYDKIVPDVAKALVKELTGKQVDIGTVEFKGETKIEGNKILQNGKEIATINPSKFGGDFIVEDNQTGERYAVKSKEEALKKFTQGISTQQSVDVTTELAASVSEGMPMFMARQQEPSFKSQMIDLANAVMQRELSKGRTLEEARVVATSDVSAAVISNTTGKFNNNAVQRQIERYIEEAYNERKIAEQAAARQRRITQAYTNTEAQAILADANKTAQDIAQANVGKKTKVTSKQAYDTVLAQVKAGIDRMYANGTIPAGVSWIDMMSLAPAIASDAVRASFPAANRQRFEGEDMVTMSTSQLIREAIKAQARTAKELAATGKEVNAIFKALLSQMTNQFGGGLQLSTSAVKSITKAIQDNIFSNASIVNVSENAAEEISKILEKAYRAKLVEETSSLFDRVKSIVASADFITEYAKMLTNLVGSSKEGDGTLKNTEEILRAIANSDASLEDIARLNTMLRGVTSAKEGQRERRIDYIAPALRAMAAINPTVQQQVDNKYESLLTKIKGLIAKATGSNAQNIASLDYQEMLNLMHSMEEVENRKQNIGDFTPEEQAEIMKQYGILKLSPLGDIQQYVQTRENEIKRDTALLVDSINQQKRTEASTIREKIPNMLLYNQFLDMMGLIDDKYLSELTPKEMLALKSALTDIVNNGNYNNFAYNQYIKAAQHKIRREFREWAVNISKNRERITKDGFTNMFKDKFKDFAKTFGSVEGSVPSADLIAKAFDMLFFHQMDVQLNTGFDDLGMGYLERELFGQLSVASDKALNKSQTNFGSLQEAMVAISDKSNRVIIKKAVGNLWKKYKVGDSLMFKRMMARMRRNSGDGLFEAISTRMASIIANQIDHISNPTEKGENGEIGYKEKDMILQRNILKTEEQGMTFEKFFQTNSLQSRFTNFDDMVNLIAYAALTENGTTDLKGLTETELLNKLTPKQREGVSKWREYIDGNKELFEATQIITGNMKPALNNYIPRRVISEKDITKIGDVQDYMSNYMQAQVRQGVLQVSQGQLKARVSDTEPLELDLNKVLVRNARNLNAIFYAKPFIDSVKGMDTAIEDLGKMQDAEDVSKFASEYANGIKKALTNKTDDAFSSNERSLDDNFTRMFRAAAATQSFAAKMWLLSIPRQLNDFVWNFTKTASALVAETKRVGVLRAVLRVATPFKAYAKTEKGRFKWDDYVSIADYTGSPIYKIMSLYADNFVYEFRKTPEQLQRQQRASSWQDMSYKKVAWMEKFENSFYRITGEYFDHEAFKDERGTYRAINSTAVQKASLAADSFIDRQYGLASVARQPLRRGYLIPFVGKALRNTFGRNILTVKKDHPGALLTGFMMGYATRQYALTTSYMKRAFDTTTEDNYTQRLGYLTRAMTEAVIPVYGYSLVRTIVSNIYMSVYNAISNATGDDEKKKKILNDLETKSGWERYLEKTKLSFTRIEEDAIENLVNTVYTVGVDPQTQFMLRNIAGLALFHFYKRKHIIKMQEMDRAGVKQKKKDIKEFEKKLFGMFNIKMLGIYGGDEYNQSVQMFYNANEAVVGYETSLETLFGFSALTQVAGQIADMERLVSAAEGSNVNKTDVAIASALQLYGLIFSNMYAPGGIGAVMSMLSGDATKAGRYIMGEQMRVLKDYNWDHRKEKPRQMIIYPGEKKGKMPGGGSPYGGGGAYGGKGAYGGGGAY